MTQLTKLVLSEDGSGVTNSLNLEHVDEIDLNGQTAKINFVQKQIYFGRQHYNYKLIRDWFVNCFRSSKLCWRYSNRRGISGSLISPNDRDWFSLSISAEVCSFLRYNLIQKTV